MLEEQFRSLKEKDTYEASVSKATINARTLQKRCEKENFRFFPRTQRRLKIAADELLKLAENLNTAFEIKKKLLMKEEEISRYSFGSRPSFQIRLYFPYDIFDFLQEQEEIARRESELLALREEAEMLRASLESNSAQANAVIMTIDAMIIEIESDLQKESTLEYDEFLRERLRNFNPGKDLRALWKNRRK